jgi:Tfp pilus assembly protein PilO
MMRHDRLWQLGGALCAIVIVAFGFFFFIGPKYRDAREINHLVGEAEHQMGAKQHELNQLSKDNRRLQEFKDQLDRDKAALPTTDAVSNLLRELQTAGEVAGVTVSGVTVGGAVDVKNGGASVFALPVSLTVAGPTAKINPFLDQLQKVQPRAVLISSVNFAPSSATALDRANVTINLQAFYASGS